MSLKSFLANHKILSSTVIGTTSVIIVCFGYITLKIYLNRRKYRHIPGRPVSGGILGFYLGHAPLILKVNGKSGSVADIFVEDIEKYGTLIKYHILHQTVVVPVGPEAIKKILITENLPKHALTYKLVSDPYGVRFFGVNLVTEIINELWKKKRTLYNPAFHRIELQKYMNEFNRIADATMKNLSLVADGKTIVKLHDVFSDTAFKIITSIAFGIPDVSDEQTHLIRHSMAELAKAMKVSVDDPFKKLKPGFGQYLKNLKESAKNLRDLVHNITIERLKAIKNEENVPNDILTFILKNQDGQDLDIEAIADEQITFMFAGHETTASALGFFFLEVGRNRDIFDKIKNEIDSVIGARSEIIYDDLNKLEYTNLVWKETLRLYPSAPRIFRETDKDTNLNGYNVPKNTMIVISPYAAQRCDKLYSDPLKFDPNRFSKKSETDINSAMYFPFSLGPRNCIGQVFAAMEAKVIIAKFFQIFDYEIDPEQSFDVFEAATIKPKDETRCWLKLRNTIQ